MTHTKILKIDVVVPVYNEMSVLKRNILILHQYLEATADFAWSIMIVDNGSSDETPKIASGLSSNYQKITYRRISVKGRGHALKYAFLLSDADIVCYMDIDLSSNINHLKQLIEGIKSGADVAIGSRLLPGSRTKRKLFREIISRIYNLMIKCLFFTKFSDAQCGFKAMKTEAARQILPFVKNNNWFFDTELLLLAEYNKYRIFEVPVEWIEDIGSKVCIPSTIIEDMAGLVRMRWSIRKYGNIRPCAKFDRYADNYSGGMNNPVKRLFGKDLAGFIDVKAEWLLDRLSKDFTGSRTAPQDMRLLDFGSGNGLFLKALKKAGFEGKVEGCDVSEGMLDEARKKWGSGALPELHLIKDGKSLPFEDNSYDVITASCVLHHIDGAAHKEVFDELLRVLRTNGRLVIFEHNPLNPLTRIVVKTTDIDRGARLIPARDVRRLLSSRGFEDVLSEYLIFFPLWLRSRLFKKIEAGLSSVPLGGQYVVAAKKTGTL